MDRGSTVRHVALRITLSVVAVLAVGAGIFAAVTYWQHVRHDDACSVYANALTASVAQPGVKPEQPALDLLVGKDRQTVLASDRAYNNQVSQTNAENVSAAATSLINGYNQAWGRWATTFKAEALASARLLAPRRWACHLGHVVTMSVIVSPTRATVRNPSPMDSHSSRLLDFTSRVLDSTRRRISSACAIL